MKKLAVRYSQKTGEPSPFLKLFRYVYLEITFYL